MVCPPAMAGDVCLESPHSITSLGTNAEMSRVLPQGCAFPCPARQGVVLGARGEPWALLSLLTQHCSASGGSHPVLPSPRRGDLETLCVCQPVETMSMEQQRKGVVLGCVWIRGS